MSKRQLQVKPRWSGIDCSVAQPLEDGGPKVVNCRYCSVEVRNSRDARIGHVKGCGERERLRHDTSLTGLERRRELLLEKMKFESTDIGLIMVELKEFFKTRKLSDTLREWLSD